MVDYTYRVIHLIRKSCHRMIYGGVVRDVAKEFSFSMYSFLFC